MDRHTPAETHGTTSEMRTQWQALVTTYYDSLDTHAYDRLETILGPDFVHERPDMTHSGRDAFIQFMREGRPNTDTSHPVDELYPATQSNELAARGRLLSAEDELITTFVDIFSFDGDQITQLRTFTN